MQKKRIDLQKLSLAALLTGVLILSSYIFLPVGDGRITLQFLAVLLIGRLLPLKHIAISITAYLALGGLGVPVFAGFGAGIGVLFGPTGGFLWSFLPCALLFRLLCHKKSSFLPLCIGALLALLCCYGFGALWYMLYLPEASLPTVLAVTILPYLLPDLLKCLLAGTILCRLLKNGGSTAPNAN